MRTKRIFLTTLLAVVALAFTACKKDDAQPAFEYKTQGFIKGKLTGATSDNSYTFNDDFNYTHYSFTSPSRPPIEAIYKINSNGAYSVVVGRSDFNNGGSAEIIFTLKSATDTAPSNIVINFGYSKELSDKFVDFYMSSSKNNITAISDFTFDATKGKVKGKFSLMGLENSSGKIASVMGDFDVIAKKVVY